MPGERILVLEDNPDLEQRLLDVLGDLGYDPTPIYDPDELLEAARNTGAAVVLLDVDTGPAEGAALCMRLRSEIPGLYIVVLGGSDALALLKASVTEELGPDCLLAKPFATPLLKRILASRAARPVPSAPIPFPAPPAAAPPPVRHGDAPAEEPEPAAGASSPEAGTPGPAPERATMEPMAVALGADARTPEPEADADTLDLVLLEGTEAEEPGEPLPSGGVAAILIDMVRHARDGWVEVTSGAVTTRILVVGGEVVHAEGGGVDTTLGRILLRRRVIDESAYREALGRLSSGEAGQERLGEALMKAGHLSAQQLHDALAAQVEDKVLEAMGLQEARVRFVASDGVPLSPVYRKPVEHVVMKGTMRHGDVDSLVQLYKPLKDRFPILEKNDRFARARLANRLGPVLERLDGASTLEQLTDSELLPAADFLKLMHGLVTIGSLQLAEAGTSAAPSGELPVIALTSEPSVPEQLREAVLREYLDLRGRDPLEALGLGGASARLQEPEVEDAYRQRLARLDLPRVERQGDDDLRAKAAEIRSMLGTARTALLDPAERRRLLDARLPAAAEPAVPTGLSAEFHYREGLEHIARGEREEGIVLLERARELAPAEPEYAAELAYVLTQRAGAEDLARARKLASGALEGNPRLVPGLLALAAIFESEGRPAQAEKYYHFTLKVDPENPVALRSIQEIAAALAATAPAGQRLLVLASDLLFAVPLEGVPADVRHELVRLHQEVFRSTFHRHFEGMLRAAGYRDGTDVTLAEVQGAMLAGVRYGPELAADRKALIWRVLSFPDLLRDAAATRLELFLINTPVPPELTKAPPRPRLAITIAEGSLHGGVRGVAAATALKSLALETDRFTIDHGSACELAGTTDLTQVPVVFAEYNYALRAIPETEDGGAPVYVARYLDTSASRPTPAAPARPAVPRKPKVFVKPSRRVERRIAPDELGLLHELRTEVRARAETDLTTKFNRLKEEEERRRKKSIWQKVLIGEDTSKVDVSRYQIKTHLFAPLLGDARVFMGMADFRRWFAYMDEIGHGYVDALAAEREAFVESGRQVYAGLAVDRTFHDFEDMSDAKLLAVSEALALFPIMIDPDERYEEVTLAEMARVALRRFTTLVGALAKSWTVIPTIAEIYRRAIDTPDDSVEAVNIFQWAVLLSLVGVTVELQESELTDLRDAYGETSRKFRTEVERVRARYGQHLGILKGGLDRYHRIRQVLTLKSPLAVMGDDRGIFEKSYHLPLFRFVK